MCREREREREREITFSIGQAVNWPPAPEGLAQVEELRRTKLRLCYRARTGTWRRPVVSASTVHALNRDAPPLPLANPFGRGCLARSKTFTLTEEIGNGGSKQQV